MVYAGGGCSLANSCSMVLPLLPGRGLPLFRQESPRLELNLAASRTLGAGPVILRHRRQDRGSVQQLTWCHTEIASHGIRKMGLVVKAGGNGSVGKAQSLRLDQVDRAFQA